MKQLIEQRYRLGIAAHRVTVIAVTQVQHRPESAGHRQTTLEEQVTIFGQRHTQTGN